MFLTVFSFYSVQCAVYSSVYSFDFKLRKYKGILGSPNIPHQYRHPMVDTPEVWEVQVIKF